MVIRSVLWFNRRGGNMISKIAALQLLTKDLERKSIDNRFLSDHGSSLSSLSEDMVMGMIAQEQARIAGELRKILGK